MKFRVFLRRFLGFLSVFALFNVFLGVYLRLFGSVWGYLQYYVRIFFVCLFVFLYFLEKLKFYGTKKL
jgi:hypothetical protein